MFEEGDRVEYYSEDKYRSRYNGGQGTVISATRFITDDSILVYWDVGSKIWEHFKLLNGEGYGRTNVARLRPVQEELAYDPKQAGDRDDDI